MNKGYACRSKNKRKRKKHIEELLKQLKVEISDKVCIQMTEIFVNEFANNH